MPAATTNTNNGNPGGASGVRTAAEIEAELNSIVDPLLPDDSDDNPGDDPAAIAAAATRKADEATATRKGWQPKDQYTGDPSKWVDAKTFNERGERFNANLQKEVASLKKQLDNFEGTRKAFVKFHEETLAKKDAELVTAITALRVQRSAAIRDGDDEGAVALEDRIDLLKEQQQEIKKLPKEQEAGEGETTSTARTPGPKMDDPVLMEWIEDGNAWFQDDEQLRTYAIQLGESFIRGGETVRGRKFLDKVATAMREEFPRRFKQAAASSPGARQSAVEGTSGTRGASAGGGTGGKTEADLPQVDRDLMRQFIKEGWTTKEKFLKGYFSG